MFFHQAALDCAHGPMTDCVASTLRRWGALAVWLSVLAGGALGCSRRDGRSTPENGAVVPIHVPSTSGQSLTSPPEAAASAQEPEEGGAVLANDLRAGDEVYGIQPAMIAGIEYESPARRVVVNRPPGGPFVAEVTEHSDGGVVQCRADVETRRVVAEFSSVQATRVLVPAEAEAVWSQYGKGAATLRIRDNLDTEPKEFLVMRTGEERTPVFRDGPYWFEPSISVKSLDALEAGCGKLAAYQ